MTLQSIGFKFFAKIMKGSCVSCSSFNPISHLKQELLNSLQENDNVEEQELNETANNVNNSQEAIVMIRCYEGIIKMQNKKAKGYIGKQGELLKKF